MIDVIATAVGGGRVTRGLSRPFGTARAVSKARRGVGNEQAVYTVP